MKYQICIWMNIPSHHQKYFFEKLATDPDFNLRVVYFNRLRESRKQDGWQEPECHNFETILNDKNKLPEDISIIVPDWQQRIHILSYCSYPKLATFFSENKISWIHWSDRGGIIVLKILMGKLWLYHLALPFYYAFKRKAGQYINKNAIGVFQTGALTGKYFQAIGIDSVKRENLYYSSTPIQIISPPRIVTEFLQGNHCFLYVGSINWLKGIRELILAFKRLNSTNWKLILCGRDHTKGQAEHMVGQYGLSKKVLFISPIPYSQLGGIYNIANVLLLPSYFDGWGMTLQEAASCGKALISTDNTGAAYEIIEPGINGFRVKAGNVNELSAAMLQYVKDLTLSQRHGEMSKKLFDLKLSASANVLRVKNALEKWDVKQQ